MNTNEKGKAFEDNVYNYFKQLIDKRYFGFDSTRTKIHKQYSAYSKDRENYIIFDIALCTRQISQNPYPIRILLS